MMHMGFKGGFAHVRSQGLWEKENNELSEQQMTEDHVEASVAQNTPPVSRAGQVRTRCLAVAQTPPYAHQHLSVSNSTTTTLSDPGHIAQGWGVGAGRGSSSKNRKYICAGTKVQETLSPVNAQVFPMS